MDDQVVITESEVEAAIASEWYINGGDAPCDDFQPPVPTEHPLRQLTICVLVPHKGLPVIGDSVFCADGFDPTRARRLARERAIENLMDRLQTETQP